MNNSKGVLSLGKHKSGTRWCRRTWHHKFLLCSMLFLAVNCIGQRSVLTWHYNNMRWGSNTQETVLNPTNVVWTNFGKLFSQPVDGAIVGEALYLPNVTVPTQGTHNVVYVATMNDT